jgi:hypothetical protein
MRRLVLFLLIVSCDERATGTQYRGAPLAVVNGRMTADRNLPVRGDVRLAVAWFTSGAIVANAPDALNTESVIYEAVFPAGFSFGLYDLPKVGAGMLEGPPGLRASAVGILMAYDDRNRNGTLDTYRPGELPVDAVLGTSLGKFGATPDPNGFLLMLVTDAGTSTSLKRGLNLVRMTGEVVSFETQVPIHLDGALEWNLFMCEGVLNNMERFEACLASLRPPTDAGTPDGGFDAGTIDAGFDAGLAISVSGSVGVVNTTVRSISLTVNVGGTGRPDASVELNGVPLVYDSATSRFKLATGAPANAVVLGGDNMLQVNATNAQPLTMGFFLPGDFSVTAPAFNATLPSGAGFNVSWSDSKDAGSYRVNVYRSNPFASVFEKPLATSPLSVPAIAYQGSATLNVEASVPGGAGPNGSFIYTYVNQSIPITLQ